MTNSRIVADLGGTNVRFAIAANGRYGEVTRFEVANYPSFEAAFTAFLDGLPLSGRPKAAAVDIAGPVRGDQVSLTNHPWSFSIAALRQNLGLSALRVMNDFTATAMAVPYLPAADTFLVGPDADIVAGPVAVIGPGTGLGVGILVPQSGKWISVPGEGGHVTMPAATQVEADILAVLRKRWDHVSAERVLSGAGLVSLYEAVCTIHGRAPLALSPAEVSDHAIKHTNDDCVAAFEHFCAMLGTVASDLAVTVGATGGIYIAGGILRRFKEAFAASGFRARFESKGRFRGYVSTIPTRLIMEESPALLGLANADLEA